MLGPPGVGKTHLAVALGVKAEWRPVIGSLFLTLDMYLLSKLKRARDENRPWRNNLQTMGLPQSPHPR